VGINRMKLKKISAIFVMVLILCIPVSFAVNVSITSSAGDDDGIEGLFDGYSDQWNIEVRAELGGTEVRPEYVTAQFARSTLPFDQCTEIASPFYSCSLIFPKDPASFPENELVLPIILKHPVTGAIAEAVPPARIGIDAHPPIVTIHSVSQQGYDTVMDLEIRDGGSRVCSVDLIEFYDGNFRVLQHNVDVTDCSSWRNQTFIIPLTDIGTTLKSIRVVAHDLVGHSGDDISDTFTLDHTSPVIDADSFRFTALGQDQYAPTTPIQTSIAIDVTEEQTTPGIAEPLIVTADFSSLGLSSAEIASCVLADSITGKYTCTWSQKTITIPSSFTVTITAEDNGGMDFTKVISKGFTVDSTAPDAVYLGGNESAYVVTGKPNTLRATFREAQSGVTAENVFLDIRGINPSGSFNLEASECVQEGEFWHCFWYNVIATQAGTITLVQVKDNANNYAINLPSASLSVDTDSPVIESIEILSLSDVGRVPYHQEGDYLEITAVVNDISGIKAAADFRHVISNIGKVEADCQETSDEQWTCVWSGIGPLISVASRQRRNIDFIFTDLVGNSVSETEPIDIIDIGLPETEPDYWSSEASPSLPNIDRRLVSRIFPYVFAPVHLNPVVSGSDPSNKWPLLVTDIQCPSDFVTTAEIFNYNNPLPSIGSTFPYSFYAKLNLAQAAPESDELIIPCTFKVMSYIYGRALPNPEIENVNVTVNYYQNPLGEVGDEVQGEIDEIKDSWLVEAEWLDIVEDILIFSEAICKAMKILNDINTVWTAGVDVINNCCYTVYASAACCPLKASQGAATSASKNALDSVYKGAGGKGMNKFCRVINCQLWNIKDGDAAKSAWDSWVDWAAETSGSNRGYFGNVKPEDSLILSIVFLCLKGVIYNLQKARQIDCRYAYCLEQTSSGVPVSLCVQQRAFALCKYVFNQIFNLIPFAAVISDIAEAIGRALANPWVMGEIALKATCRYAICDIPGVAGCKFCSVVEYASWLLETLCDLGISLGEGECKPFWETVDPIPENYCHKIGIDPYDDE